MPSTARISVASAPCRRPRRFASGTYFLLASLTAAAIFAAEAIPAHAGSLLVRVKDGATGLPLPGAFVQVGPSPGDPFPANSSTTGAEGTVLFTHASLTGPQTVTAGLAGFALQSVIGSVVDSIEIRLRAEVAPTTLPEPKAEISGTVTGITTQSNDQKLDVGIVYPAIGLSDILQSRTLPFEAPSDTVDFPLIGQVVMPGNIMLPSQTEFLFYTLSKPNYHFFVPDGVTYDFLVLSGRVPISSLGGNNLPMNETLMRQIGAERNIAVNGDHTLNLACNLTLLHTLTLNVTEAPNGTEVFATSVANLPGSTRSLFYDAKSGLRDTTASFLLSGLNPTGDLTDAVPYYAGYYADSSAADQFQAGRVDRGALTLPATRTLGSFFLLPDLSQVGGEWRWSNVGRPGVTPEPTWAIQTFRLGPQSPGDTGVTARTVWEVWVPAANLSFCLPILAAGAPGGLPDPAQTPEADQLFWDCWIADPNGGVQEVMRNAFSSLTRWSRRTLPVDSPAAVWPDEFGLGTVTASLRFRLAPNPGPAPRDILWDRVPDRGERVDWAILSPTGRRLAGGVFRCSGAERDTNALAIVDRLPTGVYWVRLQREGRQGSIPMVVIR